MLKLLKESDRKIKQQRQKLQIERDLALQDKFRELDKKRNFDYLPSGQNERNELQNAARSHTEMICKQNMKLFEKSIAKEIGEDKMNRDSDEKIRQLLWKTAPELQDLRKMILVADVCRDQALQMAEKNAVRELEREEKDYEAEMAMREKVAMEAEEKEKEAEEKRAKKKYHRELDELLGHRYAQQSRDGGQAEKERAAIDAMKKQIEEEFLKEAKAKIEKKKELRRHMLEFQKTREEMRCHEKMRELRESERVDEYRRAQELRAREQDERRKLELEQRLMVQEELLDFLEKSCREKLSWEELRTELAIEEREEEQRERTREEEMKRRQLREDLQRVYDMQMKVKKQKEDMQKKEGELFRERMMKQLFEQDKLEQMGVQKRRQKQLEHKREVEALLEESHLKRASEKARDMADHNYQMELEAERSRIIEEERIRFLKENAGDLLGYLPKGIFKDERTLEHLGEEFKKFYSRTTLKC